MTAYYSPLPNQSFYLRGNYEDDIRLNGNGTHGASGKEVYPGMLAGPKTYGFGTKIYLEGLGVGTVDDRGGAIVGSGSRGYDGDRLDIWMGSGEPGLKRALTWGKRTVYGRVLEADSDAESLSFDDFAIGKINIAAYQKKAVSEDNGDDSIVAAAPLPKPDDIFSATVYKNSSPEQIKKLQSILSDLSYYSGELDGKWSKDLESALYDFQVENKLVTNKKNYGAGFYGPSTRKTLATVYGRYLDNEKKKQEEAARLAAIREEEKKRDDRMRQEIASTVGSFGTPRDQEVGAHVRKLQLSLKALGYFSGKDTAIFGKNTREALIKYQMDRKIISSDSEKLAGVLDTKTK